MAKPRRQDGWLRVERGSWLGTWRVHTGQKQSERRCVVIGRESEMTREQAQERLAAVIEKDQNQYGVVRYLNATTKPRTQNQLVKSVSIHAGSIGAAAELLVAADLALRGFDVYRAISPTAPCDLIYCDAEGNRVRVEVKSIGYRKERAPRVNVARNAGKFDVLAAVDSSGTIHYRTHNGIGKSVVFFCENSDTQLTSENSESTRNLIGKGVCEEGSIQ